MSGIRYESSLPCPRLRPFIARFWQVESDGPVADARGRWALPDGGSEWVFVLADPLVRGEDVHRAGAYAAGTRLTACLSRPAGRMLTLGVAFKPAGAAAVLRVSASDLTDRAIPLEHVWGPPGRDIAVRLAEPRGFRARVQLLEAELLSRVRPADSEVAAAIRRLAA